MLETEFFSRIQFFSIFGSVLLLVLIFKLIKKKRLREEYSLLWIALGVAFLVLSIFEDLLNVIAGTLGILYAPAALLLVLIVAAFCILIQFSIVISKLTESNKNLVQEVGILAAELKSLKELKKPNE